MLVDRTGWLAGNVMTAAKTILFTDLDGTLLDHEDYGFGPALPALLALRARHIPVVLATSKTLAEVDPLRRELQLDHPVIVENGGAIAWPDADAANGYRIEFLSPAYADLRRFIDTMRLRSRYRLRGFGDMTADEVVASTGLDLGAAGKAMARQCSEPFLWDDEISRLDGFRAEAQSAGLAVTQGGRFWHLMGQDTSKAIAMSRVSAQLCSTGEKATTMVALGDSENDCEMLRMADIAVVIRRHDGTHLDCQGQSRTIRTAVGGPEGWHDAVMPLVLELGL